MAQISSFGGLQTSLRGILAHQRMLDVSSHNIANADTLGFTRQTAVTSAAPGLVVNGASAGGSNFLGQGVDVTSYRRMRDEFLDLSARAQTMLLGERHTLASNLTRVDASLSEPGTKGLSSMLDKLWTSFQTLANSPTDAGARAQVVSDAQTVTQALGDLDRRLAAIQTDAVNEYAALTSNADSPIAQAVTELATLNDSIKKATAAGRQPNDLLDRRDLLLDTLSGYGQVSVTPLGYGEIQVNFGDAALPVVDGTTVNWPQPLTNPGGKLGGLLQTEAAVVAYRATLDGVAGSLASTVNAIHGAPPFFSGATASTLAVAVDASTLVTGSGTGAESNDIARALANLRGGTADKQYQELVRQIGADTSNAGSMRTLSAALVDDIDMRRQSVAGVSLDEEMTNLIRFQRGYQASSRALSSMDEMLDTLINRTGRVGL